MTFAEKSSENPQWSPDGRSIAFTSSRGGKANLYVMRLIGGEAEKLTLSCRACPTDPMSRKWC